jgi:hypothetical protein
MWMNIPESVNVSENRSADAHFESRPNATYPTSNIRIVRFLGISEVAVRGTVIMREVGSMLDRKYDNFLKYREVAVRSHETLSKYVRLQYIVANSTDPNVDDITKQFLKDSLLPTGCDFGNSHSCWNGVVGTLSRNGRIPEHRFA